MIPQAPQPFLFASPALTSFQPPLNYLKSQFPCQVKHLRKPSRHGNCHTPCAAGAAFLSTAPFGLGLGRGLCLLKENGVLKSQ